MGGDAIGESACEPALQHKVFGGIGEQAWRVVHQGVEATHSGEGGMKRGLVAGHESLWGSWAALEVRGKRPDLGERGHRWPELYDFERVRRKLADVHAVLIGDDVDGQIVLVEPAGESEAGAFGAAHFDDLRDDDGAGVRRGRRARGPHRTASRSRWVKNSGKETEAASAPCTSVSPVARRAAMEKAMAMRWSWPESMAAPWSC